MEMVGALTRAIVAVVAAVAERRALLTGRPNSALALFMPSVDSDFALPIGIVMLLLLVSHHDRPHPAGHTTHGSAG